MRTFHNGYPHACYWGLKVLKRFLKNLDQNADTRDNVCACVHLLRFQEFIDAKHAKKNK